MITPEASEGLIRRSLEKGTRTGKIPFWVGWRSRAANSFFLITVCCVSVAQYNLSDTIKKSHDSVTIRANSMRTLDLKPYPHPPMQFLFSSWIILPYQKGATREPLGKL